jgi:lipoate-protein ligase A
MTVPAVYRFICSGVMNVILHFGFRPVFVPPSNIFIEGRKVSGSAQHLLREGLLQHGTLLVDSDLEVMQSVLSPDVQMAGLVHSVPSAPAPVANLTDLMGRHLGRGEVRQAMIDALTLLFAQPWKRGLLSKREHNMAKRLLRQRYLDLSASTL